MLDHDAYSLEDIARAFAGEPVGNLTRDEVLDNITMTWLTNTGVSSGRLYWENTLGFFDVKDVTVPAAVSVFPRELYQAPRSWTEKAYPNLIYFNEVDEGNHFAAWQEPELFARGAARRVPARCGRRADPRRLDGTADGPRRAPAQRSMSAPPSRPGLVRSIAHRLAGEPLALPGRGAPGRRSTARPGGSTRSR